MKLKVGQKRQLEIQKIKMICRLQETGIQNLRYSDLKLCLEADVISMSEFNAEKARRKKVYLEKKEELLLDEKCGFNPRRGSSVARGILNKSPPPNSKGV
jgi:hypothetical protein